MCGEGSGGMEGSATKGWPGPCDHEPEGTPAAATPIAPRSTELDRDPLLPPAVFLLPRLKTHKHILTLFYNIQNYNTLYINK